jgi:two-component system sensor histidine kinase GlrK
MFWYDGREMKLTLLSRLVLSYLFIFILVITVSVYAIIRIGQFNEVIRSVLMTNSRIVDSTQRLTDTFLSLIRYERKFLITKDDALYQQFLRWKNDFNQYLGQLYSLTDSSQVKAFLEKIETSHQRYQSLFAEEVKKIGAGQTYSLSWYKDEKDRASNAILEELDQLRAYSQRNTDKKIQELYEAGMEARKIVIVMTATFLVLAIAVSFLINHSITQPLSILKKKTGEIAKGIFKGDLNLSSPPEIGELANAVNLMCDKLNELDEMKSNFFSSMSHELRTPLSTLIMGLGLLKNGDEGPITEKQSDLLTSLERVTKRLIGLVNSLLDLSKMEAGMTAYHLESRSMVPLFEQVLTEMEPLFLAKRIALFKQIPGELPILRIDVERILDTLRNLIGNAVKFTPDGGQVSVSVRPLEKGVEISVSDTGPGIPKEMLATIFEKFRQSTSRGPLQMKGTGLGLAIAKQIVTYHGGRIWAESEPGRGSTFIFVLPA